MNWPARATTTTKARNKTTAGGHRHAGAGRETETFTQAVLLGDGAPRDFLERCLADVVALEPKIGAFVNLNLEGARAAADQSTARWRAGRPRSKIDGMPIGIKDIIETADMPTENGSPLFAGFRSERDGASVAALREAGAVIVGKTVTTEFASTEPRHAQPA